jgi:beta-lactamase class A
MIDSSQWLDLQKRLGPNGRLGVAARVFDSNGTPQDEITFNADVLFPMASTAKTAIAMLAASRIASGALSLDEEIRIHPQFLSPGLAFSPIDHLFYVPFEIRRTESIGKLLGFMIHRSDNTSTDVLIHRLGGVPAVAAFVKDLGIHDFHFKRTFGELIAFYYGLQLPSNGRPHLGQILASIARLSKPYVIRDAAEAAIIASGEDCCTPRAMTDLLTILSMRPEFMLAYSLMQDCEGGLNRIRKALDGHRSFVKTFGHKTGSMGGIANDVGVIRLATGSVVAISIMTSRASASMEIRDQQIAAAARLIIEQAVRRAGLLVQELH